MRTWRDYLGVAIRGRRRQGLDDTYASLNRRMFAALLDIVLLMMIVPTLTQYILLLIYQAPEFDRRELNYLINNALESSVHYDALRQYVIDTNLLEWMVVSNATQLFVVALYLMFFWVRLGATPGKWLVRIRVARSTDFANPTLKQALYRVGGYGISTLFLLLGFFWIAWDKRRQSWHDKIADTVVVLQSAKPASQAADPSDSPAP